MNVQVSTRQVAKDLGRLDILVYAVRQPLARPAEKITDAEWSRALAVNLSGAFFACRAALREMAREGWGCILLVAPHPAAAAADEAAGITATYGLAGLARALAVEYAGAGVRVNLLAVGASPDDPALPALALPVGDELGAAAVYLASSAGEGVSGAVIRVRPVTA